MITTLFRPRRAGILLLATVALVAATAGADARSGSGGGSGGHSHGSSMSIASPSRTASPNIKISHPIIVATPHHRHHFRGRLFGDWWYWTSTCAHVPHDAAHREEWRRCHGGAEVY
jgi:hypothetical protein